jgi:hypothetical protein
MEDVLFGSEFEKKITAPTGSWIAVKFATLIDPAIQVDLFCEQPWFYSPLVCSMNTMRVMKAESPLIGAAPLKVAVSDQKKKKKEDPEISLNGPDSSYEPKAAELVSNALSVNKDEERKRQLCPWIWTGENELTEDNSLLGNEQSFNSESAVERRKHYQKQKHRIANHFTPDKIYNFEVFFF